MHISLSYKCDPHGVKWVRWESLLILKEALFDVLNWAIKPKWGGAALAPELILLLMINIFPENPMCWLAPLPAGKICPTKKPKSPCFTSFLSYIPAFAPLPFTSFAGGDNSWGQRTAGPWSTPMYRWKSKSICRIGISVPRSSTLWDHREEFSHGNRGIKPGVFPSGCQYPALICWGFPRQVWAVELLSSPSGGSWGEASMYQKCWIYHMTQHLCLAGNTSVSLAGNTAHLL